MSSPNATCPVYQKERPIDRWNMGLAGLLFVPTSIAFIIITIFAPNERILAAGSATFLELMGIGYLWRTIAGFKERGEQHFGRPTMGHDRPPGQSVLNQTVNG